MADNNFGLYQKRNGKRSLVSQLMKVPRKDNRRNMPSRRSTLTEPGMIHKADLLFLPEDNRYRYALVVVDIGSKLVDAEPLKTKEATQVKKGFEAIYARGILQLPKAILQVDDGAEFKSVVTKYFHEHEVMIRRGLANRHRQIATVEAYNGVIARAIFYALHEEELRTGQTATAWVNNLPQLIAIINKKRKAEKAAELRRPIDLSGRCAGESCELLKVGDKVRRILDQPRDPGTGKKISGKFRVTDTRWENSVRQITAIILHPAQPPMYKLNGLKNVLYTRNQLQLVK